MKLKNNITSILLAAAALGLTASIARAADTAPAAPATESIGLLGQTYAGLTYSYINLNSSPVNAESFGFEYNQPLNTGFDAVFHYDRAQTGVVLGDRAHEQNLDLALRAFSLSQSWGKPYVEAGVGYDWTKYAGVKDHSYNWIAGAGVEFQALPSLTITPFVRWVRATGYDDHNQVNYGVKANYWVTKQWALTAGIDRNDDKDMTYKVGVNVRF